MTKNLMFKLRLDDRDRERLDVLAERYSAPAATVLRILLKEEFDALPEAKTRAPNPVGVAKVRRTTVERSVGLGDALASLAEDVLPPPEPGARAKKARRTRKR